MEEICRNCRHFEPKDIANNGKVWGLCPRFVNYGKPGVFRWGHSGCVDFKAKEGAKNLQNLKSQANKRC